MKVDSILISVSLDSPTRDLIDLDSEFNQSTMVTSILENTVGDDGSLSDRVRKDNPELTKEVREAAKQIRTHMKEIKKLLNPIVRKIDKAALIAEKR